MTVRTGPGPDKKLRRTLLRVTVLFLLALFGLKYFGFIHIDIARICDWGNRIVHADSITEAAEIAKIGWRKKKQRPFPSGISAFRDLDQSAPLITLDTLPEYTGHSFVVLNRNEPDFSAELKARKDAFYKFTPLDELGRCGTAFGKLGPEFIPNQQRGPIGMIRPTGWRFSKYDEIDQKYLYNRCHLLAFQLTGENANKLNLITGTRYFNVTGMLPFENRVGDYIRRTGKHVLYRVTPVFKGQDMVARGVTMEALSADDGGRAVHFHVFVYNVQPGIEINYANGMNHRK